MGTPSDPSRVRGGEMMAHFEGPVEFHDCDDVTLLFNGGSDDAGFVQVIPARSTTPPACALMASDPTELHRMRPEIIGATLALEPDGTFTETIAFTDEASARRGEQQPPRRTCAPSSSTRCRAPRSTTCTTLVPSSRWAADRIAGFGCWQPVPARHAGAGRRVVRGSAASSRNPHVDLRPGTTPGRGEVAQPRRGAEPVAVPLSQLVGAGDEGAEADLARGVLVAGHELGGAAGQRREPDAHDRADVRGSGRLDDPSSKRFRGLERLDEQQAVLTSSKGSCSAAGGTPRQASQTRVREPDSSYS